ncbi:Phosphopantetheine attachment site [Clostridium cavendishii DSM 21758]|uniref:Phosphopantetheine attachment site n=1 Tax=Clostridium cavendishii DSM 21758 TaxID=1121302 RepID=A0A1M6MS44_9CLOT|nr:SDR family NAD(P)-dependent oxidoreductase [Clostridium cavendishii]SHJ86219.1 Phosphopantetheine attachment site [Clostridium cavendishii DSM 21758]
MNGLNVKGDYENNHEVHDYNKTFKEDIAIIGMSARFPKAEDINYFWSNLVNEVDCIDGIPYNRKRDVERYICLQKKWTDEITFSNMGYLNNIDTFDRDFFKMSPAEAATMDPNQRIFLETVWHAIEDSGYGAEKLKGTDTGVYLGYSEEKFCNYAQMIYETSPDQIQAALAGNLSAVIASRIAYILDLHGPNMVINTACSSSLVSVQLACQALLLKECNMAIVGGINLRLLPIHVDGSLIESSDGRTRTFDNSSSGTGVGEAAAAVVLKPLSEAIKDRDKIYAVIKGGAITQDGNSIGITAPNADSQAMVIEKAWKNANINPETISYIEAHGTATRLGDPIEIDGIQKAFSKYTTRKQFCAIGSVKSNIGHTDSVSGLAGLIKTVLMMCNKKIPATLHFQEPNSEIPFYNSPVYIANELSDWKEESFPRRAGVSSFGLSGTNCHIVLEEFTNKYGVERGSEDQTCVFYLSANTENSLRQLIKRYLDVLENNLEDDFIDICKTSVTSRRSFNRRLIFLVNNKYDLLDKIRKLNDLHTFEDCRKIGVYYGEYNVVSQQKQIKTPKDILRNAVRKMSVEADKNIELFCKNKDKEILLEIMELYVKGADINWSKLYPPRSFNKVSLPGYPFEATRCWLNIQDNIKEFYETIWVPTDNLFISSLSIVKQTIVVFQDGSEHSGVLINMLKSEGYRIITVTYGKCFEKIDELNYIINNTNDSYRWLMNYLEQEPIFKMIVLAFNDNFSEKKLEKISIYTCLKEVFSLFYLTQSLLECKSKRHFEVILLMDMGNFVLPTDKVNAEYTAAIGFSKVIKQEHSNISIRCIDTDNNTSLGKIINEIIHGKNFMVAYRNGIRYNEGIKRKENSQFNMGTNPIRDGGVYIITGGVGGMGLSVAKYIAEKERTTLILINRTPFPSRNEWERLLQESSDVKICSKIKTILEIERLNSKVICISADVSDYSIMNDMLKEVRQRYGKINGIIHGAGVAGDGFIYNRTPEQLEEVMSGKVVGAILLDQLTKQDDIDFFVMFSAISSLTGMPGQSDYVAANTFLDSFAHRRNQCGKKTLCIDWPAWSETGIAIDFNVDTSSGVFKALKTYEAVDYFDFLLCSDAVRVIVGEIDKKYLENSNKDDVIYLNDLTSMKSDIFIPNLKNKIETNSIQCKEEVKLTGKNDGNYTNTEIKLAQLWGEVFYFKSVDIYANFYEVGGNSIFGMKLLNRICHEFNIDMNILEFMSHPTIDDLAKYINNKGDIKKGYKQLKKSVTSKEYYPASIFQKRLYALQQLDPDNTAYHVVFAYTLKGDLDITKLDNSVRCLIRRHETLRTSLKVIKGEVIQHIESEDNIKNVLEYHQINKDRLREFIINWKKPYKLEYAPLFRIGVFGITEQEHVLVFDLHHAIADDISVQNLIRDLFFYYKGKGLELPELTCQYKDYVLMQEDVEDYPQFVKSIWENTLKAPLKKTIIPYDYFDTKDFNGRRKSFLVDAAVIQKIKMITMQTETTSFMFMLTAFFIVLHKYTNQKDLIVGIPVSGRKYIELENTVGAFIKTLPIRISISENETFENLLISVKKTVQQAFTYQDYPLDEIMLNSNLDYDYYNHPWYNIIFVQHHLDKNFLEGNEFEVELLDLENHTSKFDFSLESMIQDEECTFTVEYRTELYAESTILKFIENYLYVLQTLVNNLDISISKINFIDNIFENNRNKFDESLFDFKF